MVSPHASGGRSGLAALALFSAATLGFFADLLPRLSDSIGPVAGDPVFNLYILEWGSHQISRGLEGFWNAGFWNAPFFHPTPNALALSDHLLGPALAFHLLKGGGATPQAAYNLLLLATFAIGGTTAWWVLRRSGVSGPAALLGGWAFIFSTFRWHSLSHYQTVRMQWIPLTVWSFDRLLARPTPGRAAAFLAFYVLHVSGGAYLAYLVHIVLLILVVNRWWAEPATFRQSRSWAVWVPTAAAAFGVLAFFYSGYLVPESTLATGQRPDELRRASPLLQAFLPPPVATLFSSHPGAGGLFPGFAVVALALAGLGRGWRRFSTRPRAGARPLAGGTLLVAGGVTGLAGLIVADRFTRLGESLTPSLTGGGNAGYLGPWAMVLAGMGFLGGGLRAWKGGPALRWREMPIWPRGLLVSGAVMLALCLPVFFWPLSTVMPGMSAMRVPQRAFTFVALPLAYLVAVGWDGMWQGARARLPWRAAAATLAVMMVFETAAAKPATRWQHLPAEAEFPPYAHWIAAHPEVQAYLELPRGRWPFAETVPMYFQTLHWRPLANGYSARHPESYKELIRLCQPFPDLHGLQRLVERGTTHLVVHWRALPWHPGPRVRHRVPRARPAFEEALRRHGARPVFADGDTVIFDIRPVVDDP
jgi:hypothetical protein